MDSDMLATLTMKLECENGEKLEFNKASILQGIIMEHIGASYAERLHENKRKPYSQNIVLRGNSNIWQISTLSKEAYDEIIIPLLKESFQDFTINHNDLHVSIAEKTVQTVKLSDLFTSFYTVDAERTYIIEFLSPTAFKKDSQYVFWPDLYLIYHSLIRKMDSVSTKETMYNHDTLEQLVKNSSITAYSLYSVKHSMDGVKIPAFMGKTTVHIRGTQTMANFANLLFSFGNYSGIGIKTAIGMGYVNIYPKGRQVNSNE